jgi:hypothetical protein
MTAKYELLELLSETNLGKDIIRMIFEYIKYYNDKILIKDITMDEYVRNINRLILKEDELSILVEGNRDDGFTELFKYNLIKDYFRYVDNFDYYETVYVTNNNYAYVMDNRYGIFEVDISETICRSLKRIYNIPKRISKSFEYIKTISANDEYIYTLKPGSCSTIKQYNLRTKKIKKYNDRNIIWIHLYENYLYVLKKNGEIKKMNANDNFCCEIINLDKRIFITYGTRIYVHESHMYIDSSRNIYCIDKNGKIIKRIYRRNKMLTFDINNDKLCVAYQHNKTTKIHIKIYQLLNTKIDNKDPEKQQANKIIIYDNSTNPFKNYDTRNKYDFFDYFQGFVITIVSYSLLFIFYRITNTITEN